MKIQARSLVKSVEEWLVSIRLTVEKFATAAELFSGDQSKPSITKYSHVRVMATVSSTAPTGRTTIAISIENKDV